jgi:hypothetical protein
MSKLAWISSLTVLLVAAGGTAIYYVQHQASELPAAVLPVTPEAAPVAAPPKRDDDTRLRKLEGIGSTRDLKPVPIPQGNAR